MKPVELLSFPILYRHNLQVAWSVQSHWVAAHFVVLEQAPECTSLRSNLWYQQLAPCHIASGIDWILLKFCHSVLQRPANRKSWGTRTFSNQQRYTQVTRMASCKLPYQYMYQSTILHIGRGQNAFLVSSGNTHLRQEESPT